MLSYLLSDHGKVSYGYQEMLAMITIQRADDVFSVDTEQTQRYDEAHSPCDCGYCRNYYAPIKSKLPKLDAFLVDEEPIRENERNANGLFIEYYLPPAVHFLPIAAFFIGNVPPAAHFSQQLEKWAKAHTVVSADFQPRCGVKIGTLPRNHLASSATGGASAVSAKNHWFLDFLYLQEFRSI